MVIRGSGSAYQPKKKPFIDWRDHRLNSLCQSAINNNERLVIVASDTVRVTVTKLGHIRDKIADHFLRISCALIIIDRIISPFCVNSVELKVGT